MTHPKGAIFARVSYTFRTKRLAEAYAEKCKRAELTTVQDREDSRRGWHIVHVWLYHGEELP